MRQAVIAVVLLLSAGVARAGVIHPAVASHQQKAVSRADKVTVDITGAVAGGELLVDEECGTGAEVLVLYVQAKGLLMSAVCSGPQAITSCLGLRLNQRVRLRGVLLTAPDVADPDFDACDPSTWQTAPVNFFYATKVTK